MSATEESTAAAKLPGLSDYDYVVLDIEGTTTSISFVADILFPFARNQIGDHLRQTFASEQTQADIAALREQAQKDSASSDEKLRSLPQIPAAGAEQEAIIAAVVRNVHANMDLDRKMTALKQIQGHIWERGYKASENGIRGHVYADAERSLRRWNECGKRCYIYSSGSIAAQKLLFSHSEHGDLTPLIRGNFDTVFPGSKLEAESYRKIAASIAQEQGSATADQVAQRIVFLTDNILEAKAAKEAGWKNVVLAVREGNKALPEGHGFATTTSFELL